MSKLLLAGLGLCGSLIFSSVSTQLEIQKSAILASGGGGGSSSIASQSMFGKGGKGDGTSSGENSDSSSTMDLSNINTGGMTGSDFDVLALLAQVKKNTNQTQEQKYYMNLIEIYTKASNGEFMTAPFYPKPAFYAAMHKNESGWGDFFKPVHGQKWSGGSSLRLEDTSKAVYDSMGLSNDGSSVYKAEGDSYPDGAFQVEQGGPTNWPGAISKTSKTPDKFDVYSFTDNMNVPTVAFNNAMAAIDANKPSETLKNMMGGGYHNRGSWTTQAFGIGYSPTEDNLPRAGNFIKETSSAGKPTIGKEELSGPSSVMNGFKSSGLPMSDEYFNSDNLAGTVAFVLLMKDGWVMEPSKQAETASFFRGLKASYELPNNPVTMVFPEWKDYDTAYKAVKDKYTKSLPESLGIDAATTDQRYGTVNGSYIDRGIASQGTVGSYQFIYKATNETHENYKVEGTKLVHMTEFIGVKYWIQIGMMADMALIKLALEAGMPEEMDGKIIDASDPSIFYKTSPGGGGTYNPKSGGSTDGLTQILKLMGQDVTETEWLAISEGYKELGLPYIGPDWAPAGYLPIDKPLPTSDVYNKYYAPGKENHDRRMYDCTSFTSVVSSLGQFNEHGGPVIYRGSGDYRSKIGVATTVTVGGKEYNTTNYQVATDGSILTSGNLSESRSSSAWVDVARPGDILVKAGHGQVFLAKNHTGQTVTIPANLTVSNASDVVIPAGGSAIMNNGSSPLHSAVKSNYNEGGYILIRSAWNTNK